MANADTVTVDTYRDRLRQARSFVLVARTATKAQQPGVLAQAAQLLRSTDTIRLADGSTLPVEVVLTLGNPDDPVFLERTYGYYGMGSTPGTIWMVAWPACPPARIQTIS